MTRASAISGVPSPPKATGAVLAMSASPEAPAAEAQPDQHGRRDGHRRAETGGAFQERPEAEGDEQQLQPAVVAERSGCAAGREEALPLVRW